MPPAKRGRPLMLVHQPRAWAGLGPPPATHYPQPELCMREKPKFPTASAAVRGESQRTEDPSVNMRGQSMCRG